MQLTRGEHSLLLSLSRLLCVSAIESSSRSTGFQCANRDYGFLLKGTRCMGTGAAHRLAFAGVSGQPAGFSADSGSDEEQLLREYGWELIPEHEQA